MSTAKSKSVIKKAESNAQSNFFSIKFDWNLLKHEIYGHSNERRF